MSVATRRSHAGELPHRATLQKPQRAADGLGGGDLAWVDVRQMWCNIRSISGAQTLEAMRLQSATRHEIEARYASDLTAEKRILYNGTAYKFTSVVDPDGRRDHVRIFAESGVPT